MSPVVAVLVACAALSPAVRAAAVPTLPAPAFTEVVAFATKTGFRGVVAWEATRPVVGSVAYGTNPDALNFTLQPLPGAPDTAQMVVINGLVAGTTYYYEVRDALSGVRSGVRSFRAANATTDWDGSIYTIDLLVQLDAQGLPPGVPGDQALSEIAAGMNVLAERVYDALDGHARLGNVLVTDTNLDYAANVPPAPLETPFAEACLTNQGNMSDVIFLTTVPFDSHTIAGLSISKFCTSVYLGRLGWLGKLWGNDLEVGYIAAHEMAHYAFDTPDLYGAAFGEGCRNLAWDGSLMHNTGGWKGNRWELTELDRNPTLTPCGHGNKPWSWDEVRRHYPNVPLNPNGPIDHVVDVLPRGNADGGALSIMILDREPASSTLRTYLPDDSLAG